MKVSQTVLPASLAEKLPRTQVLGYRGGHCLAPQASRQGSKHVSCLFSSFAQVSITCFVDKLFAHPFSNAFRNRVAHLKRSCFAGQRIAATSRFQV